MMTLALLFAPEAAACGGFACNQQIPVLQNAEQVVFGFDGDTVEMHVEIGYEGEAEDFAWVVPVPADPELFATTAALFDQLQLATAPIFTLQNVDEGDCKSSRGGLLDGLFGVTKTITNVVTETVTATGVVVVGQGQVGPYETVELQATSVQGLLDWLDTNGYDLPASAAPAIAPYVGAEGATFVALKLQKDKDVGDLAPLGLRYPAAKATIPVQLTSVSAVPDLRMEVYVFGDTRAVPESYLHVQINEAAIDWWNFGQNYFDVITQAANEAGGHAFATDYYGAAQVVTFWSEAGFSEADLRTESIAQRWLIDAMRNMAVRPPELVDVVQDQLGLSEADATRAIACPECQDLQFESGPSEATDDLLKRVIEPLRAAQALIDANPKLSRMTSSLDADEMTVDPTFVLNPDMAAPEVSNRHTADQVFECGNGRLREKADRRLVLANGLEIALPSRDWFARNETTEAEYLAELGDTNALVIEETGATGLPTVVADHTAALAAQIADFNQLLGCGCDSGVAPSGALAGLLGVVALWRRRRGCGG